MQERKYKLVYEDEGWIKGSEENAPTEGAAELIEKAVLEGTKGGEAPYSLVYEDGDVIKGSREGKPTEEDVGLIKTNGDPVGPVPPVPPVPPTPVDPVPSCYGYDLYNDGIHGQGIRITSFDHSIFDVEIADAYSVEGTAYNVLYIGENAFKDSGKISSLTLPSGLKVIGPAAFMMTSIPSLSLPIGCVGANVGLGAFSGCVNLHGEATYAGPKANWTDENLRDMVQIGESEEFTLHCTDGDLAIRGGK